MYWANFLHIYQPPTQSEEIVRKVSDECYRKLVEILSGHPSAKVTLNINACLTEQLDRYGLNDIIDGLRRLAERGQVEFTASAMYHPILPLIPQNEVIRQIELNTEVNRRFFGEVYRPLGFFPPEMCYSRRVAQTVREMGYRWIIVDEISFDGRLGHAPVDAIFKLCGYEDFYVFFKERAFSAGITYGAYPDAGRFLSALSERARRREYLLSGTDGEVYGHHRPGQELLLTGVYGSGEIDTCTVSELIDLFPRVKDADPLPSSWSTWEDEMAEGVPYPHWLYPGNDIHDLQWHLTRLCVKAIGTVSPEARGFERARRLLDEGLHSCQYWWASCRPWWDTGMIDGGARRLFEAMQEVREDLPRGVFKQAQELSRAVFDMAHDWQSSGKADRLRREYFRTHPQVASELTFGPK